SDSEIEALRELGESKDGNLRLRFVREAIRTLTTTRQLRYRALFALQAAVGLDERRRQIVERLLLNRLSDKGIPQDQAGNLALVLSTLGGVGSQTAKA